MTNPTPDNAWNALDLPVLTEVVDVDATAAEVPVYDFTAELDALAQAVPAEVPELALPPELTLDDVLGEDAEREGSLDLNTSQLIERLPSLDLEVDLPAELSLDDVLPGLDTSRADPAPSAAPVEDFAFSLQEAPTVAEDGLSALFARASFEPVAPAPVAPPPVLTVPLADQASVDHFAAQLDDFDVVAEMPELPGDAFLQKADAAAPQVDVFSADSRDDEWAGTWEPPQRVEPPLLRADDLDVAPPDTAWQVATQPADPLPASTPGSDSAFEPLPWDVPEQPAPVPAANLAMSVDDILASLQAAPSPVLAEPTADGLHDAGEAPIMTASHAAYSSPAVPADAMAAFDAPVLPTVSDALPPVSDSSPAVPADAMAAFDAAVLPTVSDALPPVVDSSPAVPADAMTAFDAAVLPTVSDALPPVSDSSPAVPADTMAAFDAAVLPTVSDALPPVSEISPAASADVMAAFDAAVLPTISDTLLPSTPSQAATVPADAMLTSGSNIAADEEAVLAAAPLVEPEQLATPVVTAAPPLQSISLDSLPTGVLGGGLGLAAAVAAAPLPGAPAAQLPGGGDWPPGRPAFDAGDKEVELAWARDLGAEPPLDLDELPPPQAAPVTAPVIAEVIRVRRSHAVPDAQIVPEAPAALVPPASPAVADDAIRIEAIGDALPLALTAAAPAVTTAIGGIDEAALIEALYQRVLPRMKVELTLWMQDALEQQAKQLMAGVMKQLKEDFDMMLAESLRSALREALDEAAGKGEGRHE